MPGIFSTTPGGTGGGGGGVNLANERFLLPSGHGTGTTLQPNTARAHYCRFSPLSNWGSLAVFFRITGASTNDDPCDVGIYDSSGNRLSSSGATLGKLNSVGTKSIALAQALTAGSVYYAAFTYNFSSGTVPTLAAVGNVGIDEAEVFGAAFPDMDCAIQAATYPLPATATPAAPAGTMPSLGVKRTS